MRKGIDIFVFDGPDFNQALAQHVLANYENHAPLDALLSDLRKGESPCKTVLFEHGYIDQDHLDEHAAFYTKLFKNYESRCLRLHFFSCVIPAAERLELHHYTKDYLGFAVIRPTNLQRLGRCVLRFDRPKPNHEFIHCIATYNANLFGHTFKVSGMPFMQQDTQVGVCAHASVWMVGRYMSARFGLTQRLPSEVNNLAKQSVALGRLLPADQGLTDQQILEALRHMGMSPVYYSRESLDNPENLKCLEHLEAGYGQQPSHIQTTVKLADIAYRYIESNLPVIICTAKPNHVVVGIGHTYSEARGAKATIQRIPEFFVHDDAAGPYQRMTIVGATSGSMLSFGMVESITAILPPEVSLRGEEAEAIARAHFSSYVTETAKAPPREILEKNNKRLRGCFERLEYRTYLMPSVEFQQQLWRDIHAGRYNKIFGEELIQRDYPKYIWVAEISSLALLNRPQKQDRECIGRVIIDSTAPAGTSRILSLQFADYLEFRDGAKDPEIFYQEGAAPFHHRVQQPPTVVASGSD